MKLAVQAWLDASRPKTLPLACLAILTGSALALAQGAFIWSVLILSLLTACLLQILSNLANDYGDGLRGVDDQQRIGPVRALQSGALSATQLRQALFLVAAGSVASGLLLLSAAKVNASHLLLFVVLGVLAIGAAITYTVGRKPYGYAGLGDLSVWLFFGCLGVLGSCFLHGVQLSPQLLLPASASGLLAVGVLNINNMRDIDNDQRHGKRTLAVRLGLSRARYYHYVLLAAAWLLFAAYLYLQADSNWFGLLFVLALLPLWQLAASVRKAASPLQMAPLLPRMVVCAVVVSLLFAAPLLASSLLN